jgi:hypothetical protein
MSVFRCPLEFLVSADRRTGGTAGPFRPSAVPTFRPRCLEARDRDRTGDLILTKDALYRLSYASDISPGFRFWFRVKRATGLEPATLSLEG